MKSDDAFRLISPETALQLLAALGFLAIIGLLGNFDYSDQLEQEAQAKVLRAERAAQAACEVEIKTVGCLSHPIPYSATVTQSLPSGREPTTRHYVKTSNKDSK